MEQITREIVVNLLLIPIVVFIVERVLSKRFDAYDAKRRELVERERGLRSKEEAERSLILAMARSMLLDNYEKCTHKGFYSVEEREVYGKLYESYKADGGNSVIDTLAPRIRSLPIESPDERRGHE